MATLMDQIMGEYRGANLRDRIGGARAARAGYGMDPTLQFSEQPLGPRDTMDFGPGGNFRFSTPMTSEGVNLLRQVPIGGALPDQPPVAAPTSQPMLPRVIPSISGRPVAPRPALPIVDEVGFQYRPSMAQPAVPGVASPQGGVNLPFFAQGQTMPTPPMSIGAMGGQGMMGSFPPSFTNTEAPMAAPMPPRIPGGQTRGIREPGFFERIFGGTQYQSNNMPVNMMPQGPMAGTGAPMPQYINYGDSNNAADFFRADQAMMQQNPSFFGLLGGSNG